METPVTAAAASAPVGQKGSVFRLVPLASRVGLNSSSLPHTPRARA